MNANMTASMGTPTVAKPTKKKKPAKKAPATPAKKPAKPTKKAPAKPAKKAAPAKPPRKQAKPSKTASEVYDPKHGPTQGRIRGYHIDQNRPEKHGVKRRSEGTIGGRLWSIFDKLAAKAGGPAKLEIAKVKDAAAVKDFNENKVAIEFYCWRRFNGVRGRGKKQKVAG